MKVNYVKLAAANQQLELYANTGKPLNKAAALYIVSYINCVPVSYTHLTLPTTERV